MCEKEAGRAKVVSERDRKKTETEKGKNGGWGGLRKRVHQQKKKENEPMERHDRSKKKKVVEEKRERQESGF